MYEDENEGEGQEDTLGGMSREELVEAMQRYMMERSLTQIAVTTIFAELSRIIMGLLVAARRSGTHPNAKLQLERAVDMMGSLLDSLGCVPRPVYNRGNELTVEVMEKRMTAEQAQDEMLRFGREHGFLSRGSDPEASVERIIEELGMGEEAEMLRDLAKRAGLVKRRVDEQEDAGTLHRMRPGDMF
jgi:hypothetical protein